MITTKEAKKTRLPLIVKILIYIPLLALFIIVYPDIVPDFLLQRSQVAAKFDIPSFFEYKLYLFYKRYLLLAGIIGILLTLTSLCFRASSSVKSGAEKRETLIGRMRKKNRL